MALHCYSSLLLHLPLLQQPHSVVLSPSSSPPPPPPSSSFNHKSAALQSARPPSTWVHHSPLSAPSRSSKSYSFVAEARLRELVELSDDIAQQIPSDNQGEDGPIELPSRELDPFEMPEATPLQTAASLLLTGTLSVLLFRVLRRRSQRAKETKFRSSGAESIKEQARKAALLNLEKMPEVDVPPPSAGSTFVGALVAGAIALVLYKFTTIVETGFAGKAVSTNYSIRQLTITVRTIINGLCYLATFVFAANSIGLTLYSLQLALNFGSPQPPTANEKVENKKNDLDVDAKPIETVGSGENTSDK